MEPPQPLVLPAIVSRGILATEPDTSVLCAFPQHVQRSIIMPVVEFVKLPGNSTLTSVAHVKWVMECVGKGLGLPITEEKTIRGCIHIYTDWLQSKSWVPKPVAEQPELFFAEMIKHLSQPFHVSKDADGAANITMGVTVQADACKRVLAIFDNFLKWHPEMSKSEQTVETLLRVLLGVTDSLLSEPEDKVQLADELCDDLLNVLLNVWLTVCCQAFPKDHLWAMFNQQAARWRHRTKFYRWWRFVCKNLTKRMLHILTHPNEVVAQAPLRADDGAGRTIAAMSPEILVHTWHRMTRLVDDPNLAAPGSPREESLAAVAECVGILLSEQAGRPSLNPGTVLEMFGTWLFEATDDLSQRATAQPLGALCHIFCSPTAAQHIKTELFPAFYAIVTEALFHSHLAGTAITGCHHIFVRQLPGVFSVVLPFMTSLRKFFNKSNQVKRDSRDHAIVSRSAAQLLASLACFPNRFGNVHLPRPQQPAATKDEQPKPADFTLFDSIKNKIADICLDAFKTQRDPRTLSMLLCTIQILVLDEEARRVADLKSGSLQKPASKRNSLEIRRVTMSGPMRAQARAAAAKVPTHAEAATPDAGRANRAQAPPPMMVSKAVVLILEQLKSLDWPLEVTLSAFDTLTGFVPLFPVLHRSDPKLPDQIVFSLCTYISRQISLPKQRHTKMLHTMILAGYNCLVEWIVAYPQLACSKTSLKAILHVALFGLVGTNPAVPQGDGLMTTQAPWVVGKSGPVLRDDFVGPKEYVTQSPSYRVQEAACRLLKNLYMLGQPGGSSTEDVTVEYELCKSAAEPVVEPQPSARFFLLNGHTLITAFGSGTASDSIKIVVRDEWGRSVWQAEPSTPRVDFPRSVSSVGSLNTPRAGTAFAKVSRLHGSSAPQWQTFTEETERVFNIFAKPAENRPDVMTYIAEGQAVAEKIAASATAPTASAPSEPPQGFDVSRHAAAVFFNHLGLWPEKSSASLRTELRASSHMLEITPDSAGHFLETLKQLDAVPDKESCTTLLTCLSHDGVLGPPADEGQQFWELCNQLCRKDMHGVEGPVHVRGSETCDFVFNVGSMQGNKRARAAVVWAASPQECVARSVFRSVSEGLVIVVAPLTTGLFYTKTLVPTAAKHLLSGPLMDWHIVSARILAHTICATLSNSMFRTQTRQDGHVLPSLARKRLLEKIARDADPPEVGYDGKSSASSRASASPPVRKFANVGPMDKVLSGWFKKRSERLGGREHARFFVLSGPTVEYYTDVKQGTPVGHRGTIRLCNRCSSNVVDTVLTIKTPERVWVLVADTPQDAASWQARIQLEIARLHGSESSV